MDTESTSDPRSRQPIELAPDELVGAAGGAESDDGIDLETVGGHPEKASATKAAPDEPVGPAGDTGADQLQHWIRDREASGD